MAKKTKHIFHPEVVECPYCGCGPTEGFDVVEEHDEYEGDEFIRTVYHCSKCNKNSTRCYEFYAWEDESGDEIEEDY
jgi:DNA-directed RNA polymerase subunit RPC12/RpoP